MSSAATTSPPQQLGAPQAPHHLAVLVTNVQKAGGEKAVRAATKKAGEIARRHRHEREKAVATVHAYAATADRASDERGDGGERRERRTMCDLGAISARSRRSNISARDPARRLQLDE